MHVNFGRMHGDRVINASGPLLQKKKTIFQTNAIDTKKTRGKYSESPSAIHNQLFPIHVCEKETRSRNERESC